MIISRIENKTNKIKMRHSLLCKVVCLSAVILPSSCIMPSSQASNHKAEDRYDEVPLGPEGKHLPGGYGSYGSYGRPGLGKITSYSRTPFGGHYTYVNQGPGYSHKKYSGYGAHPVGHKHVEVNELHRPGFHGGYQSYIIRPTPRPILALPVIRPVLPVRPFIGYRPPISPLLGLGLGHGVGHHFSGHFGLSGHAHGGSHHGHHYPGHHGSSHHSHGGGGGYGHDSIHNDFSQEFHDGRGGLGLPGFTGASGLGQDPLGTSSLFGQSQFPQLNRQGSVPELTGSRLPTNAGFNAYAPTAAGALGGTSFNTSPYADYSSLYNNNNAGQSASSYENETFGYDSDGGDGEDPYNRHDNQQYNSDRFRGETSSEDVGNQDYTNLNTGHYYHHGSYPDYTQLQSGSNQYSRDERIPSRAEYPTSRETKEGSIKLDETTN